MKNNISIHTIVIGELACGSLRLREGTLADLNDLPHVIGVQHQDVMQFIENQKLYSRGVGYSDFHLLAATKLGQAQALWTVDKKLNQLATELGLAYQP